MKGLSSRFTIHNGAFKLTKDAEKAKDNIWFYCIFDKFRVYTSSFGANFVSLLQKPVSYLVLNKTILLTLLQEGIEEYCGDVTADDIDIGYLSAKRKDLHVKITYSVTLDDNSQTTEVTFV